MKRICYCKKCGTTYPMANDNERAYCPECGNELYVTDMDADTWAKMSEYQKKNKMDVWYTLADYGNPITGPKRSKRRSAPSPAPTYVAAYSNDSDLARIRKDVHSIANWVKFWSILAIIIFLITVWGIFAFGNILKMLFR